MDELRAICTRRPGNEMISAECQYLTGGVPDEEGVASCQRIELIPRAAYINLGLRCLAEAPSLPALVEAIAARQLKADGFRVDFLRLAEHYEGSTRAAIRATADAITGYTDLANPQRRYLVVAQKHGLWFGEVLTEASHSYRQHDRKPFRTSSSLPSQLSRALVNLVTPPAQSLLDPFVGTGSILLEAAFLGLQVRGVDRNWKMVNMTRRNLGFFGYSGMVERGDAAECRHTAGAVVTDLPYGRTLERDYDSLRLILPQLVSLAPVAIYLADEDITPMLAEAGYGEVEVYQVRKRAAMSRFVHRALQAGV